MKKWTMALLCMIAAGMIMTGCAAGNASGTTATAAPRATESPMTAATIAPTMQATAQPSMQPGGTMEPENTMSAAGAAAGMSPAQAGRLAEQISEAVERISEVDDAETVVTDDRVLVAVEFDDQYRAGLDERMKETITTTVKEVDESLASVEIQITDDDTLYGQVKGLGERIGQATGLDELADDFRSLWDRVTGM